MKAKNQGIKSVDEELEREKKKIEIRIDW